MKKSLLYVPSSSLITVYNNDKNKISSTAIRLATQMVIAGVQICHDWRTTLVTLFYIVEFFKNTIFTENEWKMK